MNIPVAAKLQGGFVLLEALVSLLLFSIGILALVGMQTLSIKSSNDAKYRANAAFLANQIISQIWADQPNLAAYAHHRTGTTACSPTGDASTNANVTSWLGEVSATLPNAGEAKQQIVVDTATGRVVVCICWRNSQETADHNFLITAQIRNNP